MKALGVVRKIDELGRLVIPKEVRKTQGWGTGQPMEFFVEGNRLVVQAYEGQREKEDAINKLEDLLARTPGESEREDIESVINHLKGGKQ
ncbi:putative transition state regulator [Halomonas phage YPHTV-1]|nr:putative transition state regulator [Halomonas phage YPHTV-1]